MEIMKLEVHVPLKVTMHLQIDNFFQIWILIQNIGRSVIFNLKKYILKKSKFWRRNLSFTFTPEVKVYPLIDSPMMLCNQQRRTGYSVDQAPRKHLPWCNYFRYE